MLQKILLCLFVGLTACSTSAPDVMPTDPTATMELSSPTATLPGLSLPSTPATSFEDTEQRFPDIIDVEITSNQDGSFEIAVTVSSPYDTPERYADAWRVLLPDDQVLAERELLHDHASEQPFTRSLNRVVIPEDVSTVTIQGRDKTYGYGGTPMTVQVPGR